MDQSSKKNTFAIANILKEARALWAFFLSFINKLFEKIYNKNGIIVEKRVKDSKKGWNYIESGIFTSK
jgi:hypothetical protein